MIKKPQYPPKNKKPALPPPPPPCRSFRDIPFVGLVETKESKQKTKDWLKQREMRMDIKKREELYFILREYQEGKMKEGCVGIGSLDIPLSNVFLKIEELFDEENK